MAHGFNEQSLAIARVYAEALLSLADARGTAETIGEELAGVVTLLVDSPELDQVFRDPFVGPESKGRLLEDALRGRVDDLLVDGLLVVNRKGRLALLRELAEAYRRSLKDLRGEVEVEVSTAVPLSDEQRASLREAANHYTGRTARLVETVDESLMGGMVVRIGDRKIDNSVIKDLRRLGRQLAERGSKEILSGRSHFAEAD
jgi:F-type H+-transporting ATPase subunit delta